MLRVERVLERCVKQQPPQKVYDAVVSFAFNVGTDNACSSTLVKLLNQRRWADACRQLPRWVYVKGVFNQGLDNRRARRWHGALRRWTMTRALAVVVALALVALGWQSWRLNSASHTIETQRAALKSKAQELTKKNSQLIGLSILAETNNREQARLYAEAEQTSALLRQRQRRIEELKRENEDLHRWADTPLPADIIRLRERPALTGGAAYRQWLSASDAVSAGAGSAAH